MGGVFHFLAACQPNAFDGFTLQQPYDFPHCFTYLKRNQPCCAHQRQRPCALGWRHRTRPTKHEKKTPPCGLQRDGTGMRASSTSVFGKGKSTLSQQPALRAVFVSPPGHGIHLQQHPSRMNGREHQLDFSERQSGPPPLHTARAGRGWTPTYRCILRKFALVLAAVFSLFRSEDILHAFFLLVFSLLPSSARSTYCIPTVFSFPGGLTPCGLEERGGREHGPVPPARSLNGGVHGLTAFVRARPAPLARELLVHTPRTAP